jgi:hypothetical protein
MKRLVFIVLLFCVLLPSLSWGADDFYVLPYDPGEVNGNGTGPDRPTGGVGSTGAWNGPENIVWGGGGVQAGDTLWILGEHLKVATSRTQFGSSTWPKVAGADGEWITVRGDYPGNPGILYGLYKDNLSNGISPSLWTDNGNGTYEQTTRADGYYIYDYYHVWERVSGELQRYTKVTTDADVVNGDPGTYRIERFDDPDRVDRIIVKPVNTSSFADNIYFSGVLGYDPWISAAYNYVEYKNITLFGYYIDLSNSGEASNYKFTGVNFWSHDNRGKMCRPRNCHHVWFDHCDFRYCANGPYFEQNRGPLHHFYFNECNFEDIGTHWYPYSPDGHAIGIQGGPEGTYSYIDIIGCTFRNCGSGVDLHIFNDQYQDHIRIIGNRFFDISSDKALAAAGQGIVLEGAPDAPEENTTDIDIAYNLVVNCSHVGISNSRRGRGVRIYNNVAYNCGVDGNYDSSNYKLKHSTSLSMDTGSSPYFRNNISLSPQQYHVYFQQTYPYEFDPASNIYYPDGADKFFFRDDTAEIYGSITNFAGFLSNHEAAQSAGSNGFVETVEENSQIADPDFTNASGTYSEAEDFQIGLGSPALDAGVTTIYTEDFFGNPVPSGDAPDIGIFEYQQTIVGPAHPIIFFFD